jgi:Mn-containing catalase
MIARDTMHQNQWIAGSAELEADALETSPVPSSFSQDLEKSEAAYQYWDCLKEMKAPKDVARKVVQWTVKVSLNI